MSEVDIARHFDHAHRRGVRSAAAVSAGRLMAHEFVQVELVGG
jgi:hypothetical protein